MKRIISVVLLSLFASLFQGMPMANTAGGPPSPSNINTSAGDGFIVVCFSWPWGDPITNVLYSTNGLSGTYKEMSPIDNTSPIKITEESYSSAPISNGTTYIINLRAKNNSGTGTYGGQVQNGSVTPSNTPSIPSLDCGGQPAPSGAKSIGGILTSEIGFIGSPAPALTYSWERCTASSGGTCSTISGANASTYTSVDADLGKFLLVKVSATNQSGTINATSARTTAIIAAAPGIPGTPTVVAGDGEVAVTVVAPSSGGTPSSYLVTASPQVGGVTKTCTVSAASGSCTVTGLANGTAYTFTSTATNGAGTSNSSSASSSATPIATPPTVTAINSSTGNGSYKVGDTVSIQIAFSESVVVTGTPQLTLETGSTDRVLNYVSGSGTNSLTFTYTVQTGDTSTDLEYASTTALVLNGGSINDSAGNTGVLTLPGLGASGSLSASKAIVIDTTLPTVSSFSSTTSDGAYKAGSTINITATLTEAVTAPASITVTLDNGKTVVLTHSAVNNTLTGTYTVAAGDTSADLTVSSFALTSAPVDAAGNIMTDTTVPSGANNIADTKAIVIDTTAPGTPSTPDLATASDSAGTSDTDNITSDSTPTINVSTSSGTAVVTATKGSSSVSCTISSTSCTLGTLADGVWSLTVTDTDAAGNSTMSPALSITVDATAPTPTVATVSVTTSTGVTVRSSEVGTAYLIKSDISVLAIPTSPSVADDNFNQVTISSANTDSTMSTAGLVAGTYKLYVVDAAGNLSLAAASNTVTVAVAAAPTSNSTAAPTGTTTISSTLTNAVTFNGVPSPTLSYQWKSCTNATDTATVCSDISGATGSSFIANAIELVGKFIRVLVTAINGESPNATAWSSPTAAITAIAPGVPTLGTPTLGDLQINVPVTAPASNGGSTITKYQFSTDGGATWMDRTDTATVSSPIVIKFLSTNGTTPIVAGTTYPVQIRAVNSASSPNGLGTASVSVVAATAPGAPTAVSATATGQTTATVSFTAPASNGGSAITSYTVTSSPGGVTGTGSTSPITVSGLTASTAYTFTVTASNAAATSVASTASTSVTTSAPPAPSPVGPSAPAPEPEPVCEAACIAAQAAAVKAAADKVIADRIAAEAKVVAEKIASDTAAKVVADKVVVDKSAAEAAAKTAVDKAAAAAVAKAAADAAVAQAAVIAKAAADAQAAAVVAAANAAAALKSATTSAATKAAATATAAKAATTAANTVQAAAAAAKVAATAKSAASNASKQVDIALGALNSKTAAATSAAQANAIAAAAKAAANEAAKSAADQAVAAKRASNNANREAAAVAARIATEQTEAATAATVAKVATDAALKATEEKIAAATDAQKSAEAVVKALEEKIALAEASVKAKDMTERAAIDKKIEEVTVKVAEAQRVADAANVRAEASVVAEERAQVAATAAAQQAEAQAAEAVAVKAESTAKTAVATKAAADASLAAKVATAAKAAAAKVPAKAVIAAKPSTSTNKNSATATISGLKPGQKVKVTVNVKGK
jgi:hypothetical protein